MPKVSIIIPTYNNAHFLEETLASIYRQTFRNFEIVVVDDGSTDDTREVLEKHAGRIRYLHQENSGGCSKPRNEGIKAASGEYIAIFDADDLMTPEKLECQVEVLEAHPGVDFVFTDFRDFRGEETFPPHTSRCRRFRGYLREAGGEGRFVIPSEKAYRFLIYENYIGASTMMFRRALLEKVGWFDETLPSSEDLDFTFRATAAGDIGFVDQVGHLRRLHATSMSTRTERVLKLKIAVRERQLSVPKDGPSQRQLEKAIGRLYCSLGRYYKDAGRTRDSLVCYMRGCRYIPVRPDPYRGFARTLLARNST